MKHDQRLVYSPISLRPQFVWPGDHGVAVWVVPNIECYDLVGVAERPTRRINPPDVTDYSYRDYGNRVGFWRMLEVLDRYETPCTASTTLAALEDLPCVRDAMLERNWAIVSHGIYNTRPIFGYTEKEEAEFLALSQRLAQEYANRQLIGMLGPAISATENTCDLMPLHGFRYHADWAHDEQPRPLRNKSGLPLISIPYSFTVNDFSSLFGKHESGATFVQLVKRQIEGLLRSYQRDGQARVGCVALHPFLVGQPYMYDFLDEICLFLSEAPVWLTTGDEIAETYIAEHYDTQLAYADQLADAHDAGMV